MEIFKLRNRMKDFIDWKNNKKEYKDKNLTQSEHRFLTYLLKHAGENKEFEQMLIEIGNKQPIFNMVYNYYKETKRTK